MKARTRLILAAAAIGIAGCAAAPLAPGRHSATATLASDVAAQSQPAQTQPAATQPASRSLVPLNEIEPRVSLPPNRGNPDGHPPLESVELYAQFRIALLDHQRAEAIKFLEKAAALDPGSFELHSTLGRLYLDPREQFNDRSIEMLEKAAAIEPDHLDLQNELGRQCLAKGDDDGAIKHLRLALLTSDYPSDIARTCIADFSLGSVLRKVGYDAAALEVFQRLSTHLKLAEDSVREHPEIMPLLQHADAIEAEICELLAKCGRVPEALSAYAARIKVDPGRFDLRKQLVHLLMAAHRNEEARQAAEDAAVHFRADAESIALLNQACLADGQTDGAAGALTRLHAAHPTDNPILYALADLLRTEQHGADAERVLEQAARDQPGNFEITRRRYALAVDRNDRNEAARMLVAATARRPELVVLTAPLWMELNRPSARGRLRYVALLALTVPKEQEASKWFWVWRLALAAHREDVAHDALERSARSVPAFAPAFRDLMDDAQTRENLDDSARDAEIEKLLSRAQVALGQGLALELRGQVLLNQKKPVEALAAIDKAYAMGWRPPELLMARAEARRENGDDAGADATLWGLIGDVPGWGEPCQELYLSSIQRKLEAPAERVITTWLAVDPSGVTPWRMQALQYIRAGRADAAEAILTRTFNEHRDDPEAIAALGELYAREHRTEAFVELIQQRHARDVSNFALTAALVDGLLAEHRVESAGHIADSARLTAGDDADLLYAISGLYNRIGQKQQCQEVLQDVLKLEPSHPGACNDLGFFWSEEGKNLAEAQALIKKALEAEPNNISFLDSMGWLLYKRGQFAEARKFMDRAIGHRKAPKLLPADPVLLDHRGDILYRLGDKDAAGKDWQRAAEGLSALGDNADAEMKTLKTQLLEKSRQLKAGDRVSVSPTTEPAGAATEP